MKRSSVPVFALLFGRKVNAQDIIIHPVNQAKMGKGLFNNNVKGTFLIKEKHG